MAHDISGPLTGPSAVDPARASHPPGAAEAPQPTAAAEGALPASEPAEGRRLLYATLPGCWGALVLACLSFTPSLLPRSGIVQGLVCGITAAIGYGLGVLAASIWRAFADRAPRHPRAGPGSSSSPAPASCSRCPSRELAVRDPQAGRGHALQHPAGHRLAVRRRADLRPARGDRARRARRLPLGREPAQPLDRAARGEGDRLDPGAGLTYLVVTGLLLQGLVNAMNSTYSLRDTKTAAGVQQRRPACVRAARARSSRGTHWAGRAATSPARAPPRVISARSPVTPPWRRSGSTPGWHRPPTRNPGPPWPSGTCSARAVSAARTCSWSRRPAAAGSTRPCRTRSSTSAGAIRPPWRSSTPTCPRGSPTWWTSPRPATPAAPCSTRSTPPGPSCPRASGPGCSSPGRAWDPSAARPPSAVRTAWPTSPAESCSPDRPTSTRCSASSPTSATRAARRSSPSTRTGGSSGSPTTPPPRYRRRASPGTAPGSCT